MKYLLTILIAASGLLSCSEEKVQCAEKINVDCICTMDYSPVCGCNNKTYGNKCEAECAGIKEYSKGACPE